LSQPSFSQHNREPGLWKKLSDTLLATMAAEQWSTELGDGEETKNLVNSLRSDPSKAQALFESYTVGRSPTAVGSRTGADAP
jgi:hypothetical protein